MTELILGFRVTLWPSGNFDYACRVYLKVWVLGLRICVVVWGRLWFRPLGLTYTRLGFRVSIRVVL